MKKDEFIAFLDSEKSKPAKEVFDPAARLAEWSEYRKQFDELLHYYLDEFLDSGSIELKKFEKSMFEERLGSYDVQIYELLIGNKKLKLEPIGTLLIGSKGRYDLIGPGEVSTFVLVPENSTGPKVMVSVRKSNSEGLKEQDQEQVEKIQWTWKLLDKLQGYSYKELNSESFYEALMLSANA